MGLMNRRRLAQLEARIGALGTTGVVLEDGAVDTAELATDAVTAAKIAAGAVDTSELATDAVTAVKITDDILTGDKVAVVADANTDGALLVAHRILVAAGGDTNVDVALADKTRIIDAVVHLKGAGTAGCSVALQNVTTAISDTIDTSSGSDKGVFRPATMDDAQHEIAAAANLRVATLCTKAAGTLTMDTQPSDGDTVTIDAKTYTWQDTLTNVDGNIFTGADLAAAKLNLGYAIAASGGTPGTDYAAAMTVHPTVTIAAFSGNDAVLTAITGGTAGDSIATTETFTAGTNVFDAATLGTTTAGTDQPGYEVYVIGLKVA